MLTNQEHKEQTIQRMIKAGAYFSRLCRIAITGERFRPCVEAEKVLYWKYLVLVTNLPGKPLVDYANSADLHMFYLGTPDQHSWDEKRWEDEIRNRMGE